MLTEDDFKAVQECLRKRAAEQRAEAYQRERERLREKRALRLLPGRKPRRSRSVSMLTTAQVAKRLAVKPATVAKWRLDGRGPRFIKIGGAIRYPLAEVQAWIAARLKAGQE